MGIWLKEVKLFKDKNNKSHVSEVVDPEGEPETSKLVFRSDSPLDRNGSLCRKFHSKILFKFNYLFNCLP